MEADILPESDLQCTLFHLQHQPPTSGILVNTQIHYTLHKFSSSAARENVVFRLQICHQLWHIPPLCSTHLPRESNGLRAAWALQKHLVSHTFTYTPKSKIEQQQGTGLKCEHRLYRMKLWAIFCL